MSSAEVAARCPPRRYRQPVPSTRRTSCSAATPTSSCSAVGSRVENRRWISKPGPVHRPARAAESGLRSANTNSSTAPPTPASAAIARATGPGSSTSRSVSDLAGDREGEHRPDQVRAAAPVLLRHLVRIAPLLVAADRLVLDRVVGGEARVAQRRQRRQGAEQRDRELAADGRAARAAAAMFEPIDARGDHPGHRAGPRTAAGPSSAASAPAGRPPSPRRGAAGRAAAGSSPAARGSRSASGPTRPRSRRPRCGRRPPTRSARGSAGRCEAPSRRAAAARRLGAEPLERRPLAHPSTRRQRSA